jgi:tetratricopeptide (TPR) repeat protein
VSNGVYQPSIIPPDTAGKREEGIDFLISRLEIRAAAVFTPCGMQVLTLFVSSPGDVRDERQAVGRIVERLQARYWNFIRLEPVLWEKEPLRATAHFNEELIRPSDCDLFVGILWSRLGSPLPSQFNRKDGTRFDSGTEWELEEATEAFDERAKQDPAKAKPDILVYRRTSEPPPGDPGQEAARKEQRKKLDAFCERFFFNKDKTIRRAFSPYGSVDEFSSLFEQHLEKLLLRHIELQRGLAQDAVRPLPLEGSPFKGLEGFEFEDAPLFFGRNRPIAEALAKLKENHAAGHAFLLIYGGSGYGKSSLMKAGLAPRLMAEGYLPDAGTWCGCGLRPVEGDSPPLETLARALAEALPDLSKLRDTSQAPAPSAAKGKRGKKAARPIKQADPVWDSARLMRTLGDAEQIPFAIAAIIAALDRVSAGKPAQLLLLVDQVEEIFTAKEVAQEMRDQWFHVLAALAMSRRVWVVATMRSEFFPRVPEHRDLFQLVRHGGGYILSPPELPELHQIIRYPALSAGLQFERHPQSGRDLSEQIYQDAADAHDALPLLEFTLEELYQRRRENVLTWSAYEELGGLSGAIARRAQETYDALPSETRREAAQQIFGELVTIDSGNEGPATRRRARRELLEGAHPGAAAFLHAFIEAKLLVTGVENNIAVVTLAHEALITHWPVLKQWIEDHRDLLLARRRLEDATRLWVDGRKSTRFYLTEGRLAEAERVDSSGVFRLSDDEAELVRLSRIRARRKLRLFQGATVVFAGLAIGAGALGVIAREKQREAEVAEGKANDAAAETRRSLAAADFDAGAARVAAGSPDEALPYLLAALEGDPANLDAQALLLETLRHTAWSFPALELRHPQAIRMLSFGDDRDTLFAATDSSSSGEGFNTTLRWDLQRASIDAMLAPRWGEITLTLSVAPGAKRLVLQRDYKFKGDADLCDAENMKMIARLPVSRAHKIPATCFAWSPDGLLFAYPAKSREGGPAAAPYVWRIIDATSGKTLLDTEPLAAESAAPLAAHLNRERLRVAFADGSAVEYPVNPTAPVLRGKASIDSFDSAVFSPDGSQILTTTGHDDGDPEAARSYAVVAKPEENLLSVDSVGIDADDGWTSTAAITERFPWARWEPAFWEHAAGDAGEVPLPLKVEGSRLEVTDIKGGDHAPRAPIRAESQIECAAFSGSRVAVGTASGLLSIHEVLPRIGHGLPPNLRTTTREPDDDAKDSGWRTVEGGKDSDLQHRGHDWRLAGKDGEIVSLQPHPNWMYPMYAARPADRAFVVMGGYSAGSAGYSSAGMVVCDIATGALTSDLEPVDEIRGLIFLGESHRVAAMASTEVIVADAEHDGFRRIASLPVVGALSLYHIASRGWLAVATANEVHLFDEKDFSQVATLALGVTEPESTGGGGENAWAEDPQRGWLAYRSGGRLDLWSLRNDRALVSGLSVPTSREGMVFSEEDGVIGLEVAKGAAIRLARTDGIGRAQLAALREFSACLSGTGFAAGSRSVARYSAQERREQAGKVDRSVISPMLAGSDVLLDRIGAIAPKRSTPEAWVPVWERLAVGREDGPIIARRAAELGTAHPWFRNYIRGLIGHSDGLLHAWQRGEVRVEEEEFDSSNPLPHDDNISTYHRLAGDPDATRELKQAAWLALRTDPQRLGEQLVEDTGADEFPELDLKAVENLDPAALKTLRTALNDGDMRDWRRVAIDELPERGAALEKLDARVAATLAAFEKDPSVPNAVAHAEALALRGELEEAEKFLTGKVPDDAVLDLGQAHFLIASRLDEVCVPSVDKALDILQSPWLWKAWLEATGGKLDERITRVMTATDGRGPASVAALKAALKANDPAAIAIVLELAKDMPVLLREYAAARALWAQSKKAEVFALWPDEVPDFQAIIAAGDWGGWEEGLTWKETSHFTDQLSDDLKLLQIAPEATVEDLRVLAARLLVPETTATFGVKRVRDAMVACGLQLAYDAASDALVMAMVERARLAGAPNAECLRIEARNFMAAGDFTGAYARWVRLFETEDKAAISSDYLEAAGCVMEDMQPAAAIELLARGRTRYPADPDFALDAAWLLLTEGHPNDSGRMLEHGFAIPFTPEQRQTALALLVCAAEQAEVKDRADQALAELVALSPDWGTDEFLNSLDWPDALRQSLLAVAQRNR